MGTRVITRPFIFFAAMPNFAVGVAMFIFSKARP